MGWAASSGGAEGVGKILGASGADSWEQPRHWENFSKLPGGPAAGLGRRLLGGVLSSAPLCSTVGPRFLLRLGAGARPPTPGVSSADSTWRRPWRLTTPAHVPMGPRAHRPTVHAHTDTGLPANHRPANNPHRFIVHSRDIHPPTLHTIGTWREDPHAREQTQIFPQAPASRAISSLRSCCLWTPD